MISRMHINRSFALLVAALVISGCTPGGGGGGGDGPTGGGQGIPEGTYAGTLRCHETTSAVTEGQDGETVLGESSPSYSVSFTFGTDGIVLDANGNPLAVGSQDTRPVGGVTASLVVREVTLDVDRLSIVATGSATVNVPGRNQREMLGPATAIYEFAEPDTVSVATNTVLTSNVINGEFIMVVAECTGDLPFQP